MTPYKNFLLVLGMTVSILALSFSNTPSAAASHSMVPFSSKEELQTFIKDKSLYCAQPYPSYWGGDGMLFATNSEARYAPGETPSHSETNNQVAGVDELDTVKNDGLYIYTANNNKLVIVKAYPATEAVVVATISVNGTIIGLFVNGDKLAIIGQATQYWTEPNATVIDTSGVLAPSRGYYGYTSALTAWVYDIENRDSPVLRMTIATEGNFIGSRMIGDFVYLVASQYVYPCGQEVELPKQIVNNKLLVISSMSVYHSDMEDYSQSFTNVLGFDISRNGEDATFESFLLGSSGTIYVSTNALYLTSPSWSYDATIIHRISLDRETITYEATGEVPGHVLNQFSMDEYGEFFRVATHSYGGGGVFLAFASRPQSGVTVRPSGDSVYAPGSNVYVLDRDLVVIGRLEGLGVGETFHSARFMGDRAYLVTFKKIDPLFVVDLQDPTNPTLLGELKVPGYSDYLQPYDETHLIGIGKDADDQGSFAWYQGVKVSLFDVSDPENPKESGSFIIGDRGTDSPALYEHKAVLFDKDRNLLVIPVTVVEKMANQTEPWAYGTTVFQGAYVFNISPEAGVEFRGGITHLQSGEVPYYGYSYDRMISRSLFIDNVLYTLSSSMIKMSNLDDLSEIGSVSF